MYRLEFMKGNDLLLSAEQMGMFSQWVGLAPFAFPSQRNSWEALKGGADESYSALGILEEDASCVQYLSHLLRYVKEHRIKAAGDPICRTFLSINKKENYHRFRQVWLPVAEEPGQLP